MNKVIKFDQYEMNIRNSKITMDELLSHYNFEKIVSYCKACPNYDKIWSCPPFEFKTYEYLNKFSSAIIFSGEILFDLSMVSDKEKNLEKRLIFDSGRKKFRKFLMTVEEDKPKSKALIAGHCYLCDKCSKLNGEKCSYPKQIRYSLEGMGIEVGSLLKKVLKQSLQWDTKTADRLITVGAILIK